MAYLYILYLNLKTHFFGRKDTFSLERHKTELFKKKGWMEEGMGIALGGISSGWF